MRIRDAFAIPLAMATTLACGTIQATPALAANTQATITYDGNEWGAFAEAEGATLDSTKTKLSYTVDTGVEQTVIDAPGVGQGVETESPTPYDPQGGKLDNGKETDAWTCTYRVTKDEVSFTKWNTKVDGTGDDYAPGAKISVSEDTTLYAQWKVTPKITHDALIGATREGYTFDGWFTQAEGGEYVGKAGDVPSTDWEHKDVDRLYAHWIAIPETGAAEGTNGTKKGDLVQTGAIRDGLVPVTLVAVVMGVAAILYLWTAKKARA